jgi:hypothetical protein
VNRSPGAVHDPLKQKSWPRQCHPHRPASLNASRASSKSEKCTTLSESS